MIIDPSNFEAQESYKLSLGSVVPRPIAWASTVSREGTYNLAPFSFFTVVSSNPPMLRISVGPRQGGGAPTKDTLENIQETEQFVIHIVSLALSSKMHESSKDHPPEADEFEKAGLTPAPCEALDALRAGEAGVSMECVLDQVLPLGSEHLVIGRMIRFHVRDELYEDGRVDGLDPLGRLTGNYTRIETIFDLPAEDL